MFKINLAPDVLGRDDLDSLHQGLSSVCPVHPAPTSGRRCWRTDFRTPGYDGDVKWCEVTREYNPHRDRELHVTETARLFVSAQAYLVAINSPKMIARQNVVCSLHPEDTAFRVSFGDSLNGPLPTHAQVGNFGIHGCHMPWLSDKRWSSNGSQPQVYQDLRSVFNCNANQLCGTCVLDVMEAGNGG